MWGKVPKQDSGGLKALTNERQQCNKSRETVICTRNKRETWRKVQVEKRPPGFKEKDLTCFQLGCDCSNTAEAPPEKSSILYFCASWERLTSQRLTQPSTGSKPPAGQNIKILCLQAPTSSFQIVAIQIFQRALSNSLDQNDEILH